MSVVFYNIKMCILVYLWLVPHSAASVTHLWFHGMYVHMYVCIYLLIHSSHNDAVSSSNYILYLLKCKTRVFH